MTDREAWKVRWWLRKPRKLVEVLQQAQLEGGFVFAWGPTGVARYIHVAAGYSAGSESVTFTPGTDTSTVRYSHVKWSSLMTKQEISYNRHPADEERYLSSHTETNTTARTAWNIQTEENVTQRRLEMLVESVDLHAGYYDQLHGDLRQIVDFTTSNFRHFLLETGDIFKLTGNARFFMLTKESRREGQMSITGREVG